MYTEDDDKVTLKKDNSKDEYNDFYTSFNEMDEDLSKNKKNKKNKKPKKEEKNDLALEEDDYSNFYDDNETIDIPKQNEDNKGKKNIIKYSIILVLIIVAIILSIVFFSGNSEEKSTSEVKGDIELNSSSITLTTGGSDYISYKIVDTESNVSSNFVSSDTNVATVDENGKVTAIGPGETVITIFYTIDGVNREKKCTIKVDGPPINEELVLNLKFSQGSDNNWTNKDVVISVDAHTELGLSTLKYGINCGDTCNYVDVVDNKITISNNGTTKVKVKATDKKNKEVVKEVTVKIDKEEPSVELNGSNNITSNKDVEVCATCTDSISGCKQQKVCKKFTSSKSNQTITVTDNAGNTKKSSTFNVTINKMKEPCSLSVSKDGTVKATLRESAKYYGFNSNYSGSNALSKKVDISNVNSKGQTGAIVVWYYVLNKNGSGGKCYITVIKECSDNNVCTFRSS